MITIKPRLRTCFFNTLTMFKKFLLHKINFLHEYFHSVFADIFFIRVKRVKANCRKSWKGGCTEMSQKNSRLTTFDDRQYTIRECDHQCIAADCKGFYMDNKTRSCSLLATCARNKTMDGNYYEQRNCLRDSAGTYFTRNLT